MKRRTWLFISLPAAAIVAAFFTLALTGVVGTTPDAVVTPSQDESYAPGQAALRATINQETGEVEVGVAKSSAPLDPATANALRRDTEGLKEVVHPDGSVSVNLEGRFQSVSVVHLDENGKLVICTDDHDHAVETLTEPQSTPEVRQTPEVR